MRGLVRLDGPGPRDCSPTNRFAARGLRPQLAPIQEAKALFTEQMHRNEVTDLEIEDLSGGDIGAAAAETKALAIGDPRYLRQVQLDDDVKRLTALERAHHEAVRRRDFLVATYERTRPPGNATLIPSHQ